MQPFYLDNIMPKAIQRACRYHGCRGTTTHRSGYCNTHIHTGWEQHQKGRSKQERGYGTDWTKLRKVILTRDKHLCQECLRNNIATQATTVDHITPKAHGGTDASSNLESLCWSCHRSKTAKERLLI